MNSIKHRFTLDMHSVQSQISIPASINDTARTLYINFTDGGDPYHISEGCTALLIISKPSGAKLYEWCAIKDNTNAIYPFSQNKNTASEEGICECEITLYSAPDEDGDIEQIASPRFSIVVSERAINRGDDEVLPEASIGFIDQAVKDELVRRQKEQARLTAETARATAETLRASAEKDRANAESKRATAETERASAESARKTAENARASAETARASAETQRIANEAERQRNAAEYKAQVDLVREEIETWQDEWGKISSFDKRLENIEAAVSPGLVTPTVDSTVAYSKTVPKGVLPNAAVCEVGGMSYRCENLIPFPYGDTTVTRNGITWTVNADGSVTANGTATSDSNFNLKKYSYDDFIKLNVGEACTLSGYPSSGLGKGYIMIQDISYKQDALTEGTATTFTPKYSSYYMMIKILSGKTVSNLVIHPMLNVGSTALPYQQYFKGLRDSKVTAIESIGTNMFGGDALADKLVAKGNAVKDEVNKTVSYTAENVSNVVLYDKFKENTRYTFFLYGYNETEAVSPNMSVDYTDGTSDTLHFYEGVVYYISKVGKTIKSFRGNWNIGTSVLYYEKCGIFEGYVANENFAPYFRETLPIPGDALDGFGQGISKDYCNKIVIDPLEGVKKYVKNVGVLDMGLQGWQYSSADKRFFIQDARMAKASNSEALNALCAGYTPISFNDFYSDATRDKTISRTNDYLFVRNLAYTDAAAFKTAMLGVMLLYELATPTETDVSHLFTDDNLLPVEAGGTITAVNEYEQEVPFTIEYTVKGA